MSIDDLICEMLSLQPDPFFGFFGAQRHFVQSSRDLNAEERDPQSLVHFPGNVEVSFQPMAIKH